LQVDRRVKRRNGAGQEGCGRRQRQILAGSRISGPETPFAGRKLKISAESRISRPDLAGPDQIS